MTDTPRDQLIGLQFVLDPPLEWPFHGTPTLEVGRQRFTVDPFPCYPHNHRLVREVATACWNGWPLLRPLTVHVAEHEGTERTNGWCNYDHTWAADDTHPDGGVWEVEHHIFLSGKRIPPHPAVTAYVVGHEYGHAVIHDAAAAIALRDEDNLNDVEQRLLAEYAELRDLAGAGRSASGGTWHDAPFEVLACDWRILRANVEPDFWPHPGVPRPDSLPPGGAVATWWNDLHQQVRAIRVQRAEAAAAPAQQQEVPA